MLIQKRKWQEGTSEETAVDSQGGTLSVHSLGFGAVIISKGPISH
jgi:hypothetical protein